jgi:hypothetical protein
MVYRIALGGARGAGKYAIVDDEDRELVQGYSWYLTSRGYVQAHVPGSGLANRQRITLHTLLTGRKHVDHEDRDPLNNTRRNLRDGSGYRNLANRGKQHSGTSRYKGVFWRRGRWEATIKVDGVSRYLGRSVDEAQAARLYDAAAEEAFGEYACTNVDLGLLPPLS